MPRARKRSAKQTEPSATLETYREKRDFDRTPEPAPDAPTPDEGPLTFVIQKHAARRLHYDFRLEVDGALKSWSVPKGPSLDTADKRMAVMVEDHPLDYGSFEGVIPKGEYGAGQVIVWDNGTYSPDEGGELSFHDRKQANARMREEIAAGKVSITIRGAKLKGSWTLVKMQRGENDWLLIKHRDQAVDAERDITEEDRSVISGVTIEEIKAGRLPDRALHGAPPNPAALPRVKRGKAPGEAAPMFASPAESAFADPDWIFEPKLDGVRVIGIVREGEVTLRSRSGLDATAQYPRVAEELAAQPVHEAVFDGEVVALDEEGRPSFELLQQRLNLSRDSDVGRADLNVPVLFYVFDLLYLDGCDLRAVPLRERRPLLERVLAPATVVRLVDNLGHDGDVAYEAAKRFGLEGVIAKRLGSAYEPGQRSKSWLKIKAVQSDEFVVGGFTEGQGGRRNTLGALVIGQYDDGGRLVYSGNVGSGLDDRTLAALRERLDRITRKRSPFAEQPELKPEPAWVQPEVVVEVKFAHWTRDGRLRAPVFLRLRDEKTAAEVHRIDAVAAPEPGGPDAPASVEDEVSSVLEQLETKKQRLSLDVAGESIALTNLDKELWPKHGRRRALTKRDFLVYLAKVAPSMLPHLRDRPLTLTRYPNGIDGKFFYQKHWEHELPAYVDTVRLYSSSNEGDQEYLICNNLPTLLWLGQLANLEFHTWYSRVSPEPDGHHLGTTFTGSRKNIDASLLNYPDFVVFDFDPYIYSGKEAEGDEPELNRKAFRKTCEAALWLKEILDQLSLSSFVKTTGKTGLHVYVPVTRRLDYRAVRAACETIGKYLLQQHPKDVTMEWSVEKRTGKVFFDHNQNTRGKTLASIYSVRPVADAGVSMPLRWDEVGDVYPTDFTMLTAPDRLAEVGDLWRDILDTKHDLEGLLNGG